MWRMKDKAAAVHKGRKELRKLEICNQGSTDIEKKPLRFNKDGWAEGSVCDPNDSANSGKVYVRNLSIVK